MAEYYIGLMSGTSLDGVDAVLAVASGRRFQSRASVHVGFPSPLRSRLLALHDPGADELHRSALLAADLCRLYSTAVQRLLARAGLRAPAVTAIGCHGQTVRHRPRDGYTLQLVNGARLAELTGIDVVCDFRSRDVAAGGEGAPLAPAFHRAMLGTRHNCVVVNIGGIANVTRLPARGPVTGFDSGPGNCLLDAWIREKRRRAFDANGDWAASGAVIPRLLAALLKHSYFRRRPPKSTGREEFDLRWVKRLLSGRERAADVQATLLELTARTIARAVKDCGPGMRDIFICGGGAYNGTLLARLSGLMPMLRISTTAALGIAPEHVEAMAFAWLARQALERKPGNVPAVTGARGPRVLGAIYCR